MRIILMMLILAVSINATTISEYILSKYKTPIKDAKEYEYNINKACEKYNIDKALLIAVIQREGGFVRSNGDYPYSGLIPFDQYEAASYALDFSVFWYAKQLATEKIYPMLFSLHYAKYKNNKAATDYVSYIFMEAETIRGIIYEAKNYTY